MSTLAVGGPLDQTLIEDGSVVLWLGRRPAYYRRLLRNVRGQYQHFYLHRTLIHYPPDPELVIRRFVATLDRLSDPAVIAHYWWLLGDLPRFEYARFL